MNKLIVAERELEDYREYRFEDKEKINKKKRNKRHNKNKSRNKMKSLFFSFIIFLACLFILNRYTQITHLKLEVSDLEKEVTGLEREKEDLVAELDSLKNVARIEEDARTKLGMDYPTEEQIVYVDVNEDIFENDNAETEFNVVMYFKNILNMVLGVILKIF